MPTTITVSDYQTFTAAELLQLTEWKIAAISAGAQEYSSMDMKTRHAELIHLYAIRDKLKAEVEAEGAGEHGGNVLAQFGEAR